MIQYIPGVDRSSQRLCYSQNDDSIYDTDKESQLTRMNGNI